MTKVTDVQSTVTGGSRERECKYRRSLTCLLFHFFRRLSARGLAHSLFPGGNVLYRVISDQHCVYTHVHRKKSTVFVCLVLYVQLYASYPFRKLIHNVTRVREASRTPDAEICISFSLYSTCVSPNMGSPTVIHFQCSLGNTILLLIPCGSCVFPQTPVLTGF